MGPNMPPAAFPFIQIEEHEEQDDELQNLDLVEIPTIQNAGQNEGYADARVAKKPKRKSRGQLVDEKPFRMPLNRLRLPNNGQIQRPVRTTRNRSP